MKHDDFIQYVSQCVNCGGLHASFLKICDHYVFKLKVLVLQTKDKLSFIEVREQVLFFEIRQVVSYVSLFKLSSHDITIPLTPSRPGSFKQVSMT